MQGIFKRYEKKYLITEEQRKSLELTLAQYMIPDQHGRYLVQNLYYDNENWDVIRTSVDKPLYKEKLRLRCYGLAVNSENYYLELKKKYKGVVYKRRIAIPAHSQGYSSIKKTVASSPLQIAKELDYYCQSKEVKEKIYLSYEREALKGIEDQQLRITFDQNIRFRLDDLRFVNPGSGQKILPQGTVLMEIKTLGGMPLWLAKVLSEKAVYPTSFSKVGICYTDYICKQNCKGKQVRNCA